MIVLSLLVAWVFSSVYAQELREDSFSWETQSFERSLIESGSSTQIEFDEKITLDPKFFGIEEEKMQEMVNKFKKFEEDIILVDEVKVSNSQEFNNFEDLFERYALSYGISKEKLKTIAICESGLNPMAINTFYGGLFQFSPDTWRSNRKLMGENTDTDLRFNAEEAIKTAAFKMSRDGFGAWPHCGK